MKKTLLLAIIAVAFAFNAAAQMNFGIRAGLNLANEKVTMNSISPDTKSIPGVNIGAVVEFGLSDNLFIQPAVLYSMKGCKFEESGTKYTETLNYLEIPIDIMYKFDVGGIKIFGEAGPSIAYALSGKDKIEAGGNSETEDVKFGSDDDQIKALDLGLNFGAGVEVSNFQIGLNYTLGLSNLANASDFTQKNKVFSINVAYLFK